MKHLVVKNGDGNGSGSIEVSWALKIAGGLALTAALTGGTAAVIGYPTLRSDVDEIVVAQTTSERNLRVVDEDVRNLKADSKLAQDKLDALLEAAEVHRSFRRPDVEPTRLKEPDE